MQIVFSTQISVFLTLNHAMAQKRPLILVTNDDGITAPGIRTLIKAVLPLGEVVVVAPDAPQSGMGHAITVNDTLYCDPIKVDDSLEISEFSCSGTPADCVKIAVNEVLHRKPDLLVSGVNHGSNASINVIYSGTMSAAVEAGTMGIPAIGFSLLDFSYNADFSHTIDPIRHLTRQCLEHGMPQGVVLNVNFPKIDNGPFKGIKICRQANAQWVEQFDKRKSPWGRTYYWLSGEFVNLDQGQDTDQWALDNGYISVVPVQYDLTAHYAIPLINQWNLNS
jgi:5'-nucleotidase